MNFTMTRIGRRYHFIVIISLILTGCGGEDGKKETSNDYNGSSEEVTLSAKDATYSTGFEPTYFVDLSEEVSSSDGSGFILTEVQPLSEEDECQVESYTETGFVIEASDSKVCNYSYSVEPRAQAVSSSLMYSDDGSTSAFARVAVSSAPTETELTPISNVTLINSDVETNIKEELKKVGFTLGDEFELTDVVLLYDNGGSTEASLDSDRVINYSPASNFTGIDRILYTYEDVTNGLVLMGTLDIAVAYAANEGFTIDDNIEYSDLIEVNTQTDINIDDFITSEDGDDYQLVYVESFDAEVNAKNPTDTSNKLITFKVSEPGYYYVSFAVSDHNGTYDMGLIKVRVFDSNLSADWSDIYDGTYKYTAPITVAQAKNEMVEYDGTFLDDNGFLMSSFYANNDTAETAVTYCDKLGGVVPGASQLEALSRDKLALDSDWPVSVKYLARNIGASIYLYAVNLIDGTSNRVYGSNLYVTCAIDNVISIDSANSDFEAVANSVDKAKISVNIASNSIPTVGALVSISTGSDYVSIDDPDGETDENGNITFFLDSVRAESVDVVIDYDGRTITQEVKFTADANSANITLNVPLNIISAIDVVEISSTLKDAFNNDLVDETIDFEITSPAEVTTTSDITYDDIDKEFKAKADIRLPSPVISPKGTAAYTSFDVAASYTLPSGDRVSASDVVKYTTGIGHGLNISPTAVENCLVDGVINVEYNNANCLNYDSTADNFGFEKSSTYIIFDDIYDSPTSLTAYGYWRQSQNFVDVDGNVDVDEQKKNLGDWQLQGCNDDTCGDTDILIAEFGLSFDMMIPISTGNEYSRYKLIFLGGPVQRNGATVGGNISEIIIGHEDDAIPYVCGGELNDSDMSNAGGACIKIVEDDGKMFTATPSIAFLNEINFTNYVENISEEPNGSFARFEYNQSESLCSAYNTLHINGKDNWHLTTKNELILLYKSLGSLYTEKGWAVAYNYWTTTLDKSTYFSVDLDNGSFNSEVWSRYASCVSDS